MGGLIQLAAYGNQDVFLTGNPQITFWKMVFKRHTHFAIESIEQTFNGAGVRVILVHNNARCIFQWQNLEVISEGR